MAMAGGGGNLLTVDEAVRPRANSDPTVNTCCLLLPEIKVEDCTETETSQNPDHTTLPFGAEDPPRRRSNTCPEDLFRKRNGRPPTPPPSTFRKGHKFKSGFAKPVLKESVSFTHHKLSKLTESEDAEDLHLPCTRSADRLEGADSERLCSQFREMKLQSQHQASGKRDRYPAEASSSSEESCTSQDCGLADRAGAESSKNGALIETSEDSFSSHSSVKCRCAQSSATTMDNKQLQAC